MSSNSPAPGTPQTPTKAVVAGVIAFIGLLWANLNGREDLGSMGFWDWMTVIIPTIVAFGATYQVPNQAKGTTSNRV